MGVGVSLSSLAGAVAKEGGVGVISTAQIGYEEEGFENNQAECNLRAIRKHLQRAKEIACGNGLVGVNIMVALKHYKEHVNLPELIGEKCKTKIAPIVSSKRATQLILKMWAHRYNRTADFIVVEGPKAGGHLGFSQEQLQDVATKECDASEAYKEAYINATEEDVNIIQSPVGMPGRALYNKFIKNMEKARLPISKCYNCLEKCNPQKVPYCITRALIDAVRGDVENGLVFCGANVGRIHEMTTVHQLMKDLTRSFV